MIRKRLASLLFLPFILACAPDSEICMKVDSKRVCPSSKKAAGLARFVHQLETKSHYYGQNPATIENPVVKIGENVNPSFTAPFDGYLMLLAIYPDGRRAKLFPNQISYDNFFKKGQKFYPANFSLVATEPAGLHYIVFIFTEERAYIDTSVRGGDVTFDALKKDEDFRRVLTNITNNKLGRWYIRILPFYVKRGGGKNDRNTFSF
jgi:hypothetical protein